MSALFQDFIFSLRQLRWPLSQLWRQPCQRWKRPRSIRDRFAVRI